MLRGVPVYLDLESGARAYCEECFLVKERTLAFRVGDDEGPLANYLSFNVCVDCLLLKMPGESSGQNSS